MRFSYEEISGRAVIDAAGFALGSVDGIVVDDHTWQVDAIRVRLRRDAVDPVGAHKTLFGRASIEIPTRLIRSIGDAVLLRVMAAQLRQEWPDGAGVRPPG